MTGFDKKGWVKFPFDPVVAEWIGFALPTARQAVVDPANSHWHDCDGTWFVGVDALDNDTKGRVGQSGPLIGKAVDFLTERYGNLPLHKGQVSVVYPGYPRPRTGEGEASARYRATRDAAHIDGLKPSGAERRRKLDEPHAWILGIPMTDATPDAAPLVLWEGSHKVLQTALAQALSGHRQDDLNQVDVTDAYVAARREVFETCPRIELPASPGEAYVLHRHCLHGVAPWAEGASAGPDGRMIAYFRPEMTGGVAEWIETP